MTDTPRVQIVGVTQRYGPVTALDDVSLEIADGELLTLLGPSGCGKTTLLRAIAAFIRPAAGRVLIGGVDVTRVPPHRRPVNMVFQRPTLFPHLDVAGNVAFGLRIAGVAGAERAQRVQEALTLVRLEGYGDRRAHELSGGQMQRVALARALVNRPQVLLLDEPLSALDLKIRLEMEVELRRVHRETGATFVYVTHDQREALALSDRIAVFDEGRLVQAGSPHDIYRRPATPFAARFVGDANVIEADADAGGVTVGGVRIPLTASHAGPAWLVLRPEEIGVEAGAAGPLVGTVADVAFRGSGFSYRVDVAGLAEAVKVEVSGGTPLAVGQTVTLRVDEASCLLLPRDG
jgi:ABC-type Fe3+/spermidine/putrescine transport system ATPase subunit